GGGRRQVERPGGGVVNREKVGVLGRRGVAAGLGRRRFLGYGLPRGIDGGGLRALNVRGGLLGAAQDDEPGQQPGPETQRETPCHDGVSIPDVRGSRSGHNTVAGKSRARGGDGGRGRGKGESPAPVPSRRRDGRRAAGWGRRCKRFVKGTNPADILRAPVAWGTIGLPWAVGQRRENAQMPPACAA